MTSAAQQALQSPPIVTTTTPSHPAEESLSERRMLSKSQVAARLRCSERSLERLVKHGRFPAPRRYGRAVVWFESVIDHVLGLAEQEQLQWHPAARRPVDASTPTSTQPAEPPVPPPIPEAHELEPEAHPQAARKSRTEASHTKRRERPGASAEDLAALRLVFEMPTV